MSRIILIVIFLVAASLYGAQVMEATVVEMKEAKAAAKPQPQKPVNPRNTRNVIKASKMGHFAVDAYVDNRAIAFMVDTGASLVAIRESDAARLGYYPRQSDYVVRINTANGEGRAAAIDLRTVEVGQIVVHDVRALVVPDAALSVNLLGMSFLSRVRWAHEAGQLVLEQ